MTDNLEKVRWLSRMMRYGVTALGVIVAAITLWFALKAATDGDWLARMLYKRFGELAPFSLSPLQVGLLILVDL